MSVSHNDSLAQVREYYGRVLGKSSDLKTNACCTTDALPPLAREAHAKLAPEIVERFYGCGSPIPEAIEGRTILDLGCGTGRDSYLCAAIAGPNGRVIGVDMTDEQLAVAKKHVESQAVAFGHKTPTTSFRKGYIEDLRTADVADHSVDVVISNCVINLSPDKPRVFSEIFRVLKPGGELYFSDILADRRIPASLREDPVLLGECLAGALYTEDFRRMMLDVGVRDHRIVSSRKISIDNAEVEQKIGFATFYSMTLRAFALGERVEDRCEDYGQVAIYKGTIPGAPHRFVLDDHHTFETGRPMLVCGNTAAMVSDTRYGAHFEVRGDRARHYGLFPCGPAPAATATASETPGACC
jgi:ubiquinone/menaquinone biosynthesis C-methylase UbiE